MADLFVFGSEENATASPLCHCEKQNKVECRGSLMVIFLNRGTHSLETPIKRQKYVKAKEEIALSLSLTWRNACQGKERNDCEKEKHKDNVRLKCVKMFSFCHCEKRNKVE